MKKFFSGIVPKSIDQQAVHAAMVGDFFTAIGHVKDGADPNYSMPLDLAHPAGTVTVSANAGRAAVARNNTKALSDLLEHGLDKDLRLGESRQSLLCIAVDHRAEDAALLLLSRGAKVNAEEFPHMAIMGGAFGMHSFVAALTESAAEQANAVRHAPVAKPRARALLPA